MVGGGLSRAAIIGQQGGVWATSSNLQIEPEQEQMIIEAFKNEDPSALQAGGIKLGQNKYMFLRVNGDSFYGKQGPTGVCVTKSKQAILIGEYVDGMLPVDANNIVEKLAGYLVSVGF
ncbi:MAG: profilin, required for normal timing of actin polymerization in response to thermal stress [Cyphobasidiales sp. Tagirdzhanova-0007]|nr:MAG: profilin, required for normal timing of actin polymerization in response to thermal stress [Cyphobasidiales sp. Tagirdzhanova-0007]